MWTRECGSICNVWRRQYAPVVLLVALGTAASATAFFVAHSAEGRSTDRQFKSLAADRCQAIIGVFDESAKLLSFTDNVFMVGPPADSPLFPDYVRSLKTFLEQDMARHPALHALVWAPRVHRDERAVYERTARAVLDPAFQIGGARESPAVFPAYVCVAETSGHDRLGEDLAKDPATREAMDRARDTGAAVAIAPTATSARADDRLGYRVFQPLYRGGDPGDAATRRGALSGFLCLDLDVGAMVDRAFANIPPVGIDITVRDDTGARSVTLCRHTSRLRASADEALGQQPATERAGELDSSERATFFGREVTLDCRTTAAFWAGRTNWQPWALLGFGLVLTAMGAGFKFSSARRDAMIERTVSARIAGLAREFRQPQPRPRPEPAQDETPHEVPEEPMPMGR